MYFQNRKGVRTLTVIGTALVFVLSSALVFGAGAQEEEAVSTETTESTESSAVLEGVLTIFHAGSLSVPFDKMEENFEAMHPDLDVQREAAGSTASARKISEVGKPADIMASADYNIIDKILIPEFAELNIRFATNQLVLCYTDSSRYADEVNEDNWYQILQREDVVWGHSDPNLDPCGYRSLMVMQLAEDYYGVDNLYDKLLANRPDENVRSKSVDLISLMQSGNMDYAWEYLSVAVQHDLNYIELPDQINLGNYQYDDNYNDAVVEVTGKEPGEMMELRGKSVTYGITLVKDAPNPEAAKAFLAYVLDPEGGLEILENMGQPPFIPARVPTETMYNKLPEQVKPLVEVKN
ncbi:MAG: tungstate ABC transporter substrate-binding protein WtpA [Spirochaetales bacterium]|nr:tungstate ABC transporter substrate-binding protein WtpA [Spirochaetales bacterium]MCF7939467.1 tungstate ABC transporter substrate-binding protein WtpA [Spirochaetales bacterium]